MDTMEVGGVYIWWRANQVARLGLVARTGTQEASNSLILFRRGSTFHGRAAALETLQWQSFRAWTKGRHRALSKREQRICLR